MGLLAEIAQAKGCSQAAVALAWVLAQGDDVVPLPGCSRRATLADSLPALQVTLTGDQSAALSAAFPPGATEGTRHPEKQMGRLGLSLRRRPLRAGPGSAPTSSLSRCPANPKTLVYGKRRHINVTP